MRNLVVIPIAWTTLAVKSAGAQSIHSLDDLLEQLLGPGVGLLDNPVEEDLLTNNLDSDYVDDEEDDFDFSRPMDVGRLTSSRRQFPAGLSPFGFHRLFDPFALLPGILSSFSTMPNVTLIDQDCLITIETKDLDANNTSMEIYTTPTSIEIQITKVSENVFSRESLDDGDDQRPYLLRGGKSMSSLKTIKRFPAPPGCDMVANSSKATINQDGGTLLLKFPKVVEESVPTDREDPAATESASDTSVKGQENTEASPPAWWKSLLGISSGGGTSGNQNSSLPRHKVPIPFVKYDEF